MKGLGLIVAVVIVVLLLRSRKSSAATPRAGQPASGPSPSPSPDSQGGGTGNDVLDNISQQIAQTEGFFQPGTRAARLNNPGNVGGDSAGGYGDVGDGWDALNNWIYNHAQQHPDWDFYDMMHFYVTGDTMGQGQPGFISPDQYAEQVAAAAGVDPTQTVSSALGEGA